MELSIKERLAFVRFCKEIPLENRNFITFNRGYNEFGIDEAKFNFAMSIFNKVNYGKPQPGKYEPIKNKLAGLENKPQPKVTPKIEPKVEPPKPKTVIKPKSAQTIKNVPYKVVDGFKITDVNTFNVTLQYVSKWYDVLNKKYFGGKLPYVDITVSPIKSSWGFVKSARNRRTNEVKIVKLNISNRNCRSEFDFLNTILHEMIHVYQLAFLKEANHGPTFLKEMNRINKFGWNINTRGTSEEASNASVPTDSSLLMRYRNNYYVWYTEKGLLGITKKANKNKYPYNITGLGMKWFKINKLSKDIYDLPICRTNLRGYRQTKSKIDELVRDGYITPLVLKESTEKDDYIDGHRIVDINDDWIIEEQI